MECPPRKPTRQRRDPTPPGRRLAIRHGRRPKAQPVGTRRPCLATRLTSLSRLLRRNWTRCSSSFRRIRPARRGRGSRTARAAPGVVPQDADPGRARTASAVRGEIDRFGRTAGASSADRAGHRAIEERGECRRQQPARTSEHQRAAGAGIWRAGRRMPADRTAKRQGPRNTRGHRGPARPARDRSRADEHD